MLEPEEKAEIMYSLIFLKMIKLRSKEVFPWSLAQSLLKPSLLFPTLALFPL